MAEQVQDRPAEAGIKINNVLLTCLLFTVSAVSYLIDKNLDGIASSIRSIETSLNIINAKSLINESDIKHLNRDLKDHIEGHQ